MLSAWIQIAYSWMLATGLLSIQVAAWLDWHSLISHAQVVASGPTLSFTGPIQPWAASTVVDWLDQHPHEPVTLVLQSPGGEVGSALAMAQAIKRQGKVHTLVQTDGWCASACTVVFAAGSTRSAGRDAAFFFHGGHSHWGLIPGSWMRFWYQAAQYQVDATIGAADPMLEARLKRIGAADGNHTLLLVTQELTKGSFLIEDPLHFPMEKNRYAG